MFAVAGTKLEAMNHWKAILIFTSVFAVLDVYWLPMVTDLDLRIIVGNSQVREFFELPEGPIAFNEITGGFGSLDVALWFFQGICGYFSGLYIFQNVIKRNLTGR